MSQIRRHFLVKGRVQGVGFRYTAARVAARHDLSGWVRNTYDGDVEMEIQGEKELVDTFIKRVQIASVWIRIENVQEYDVPTEEASGFRVLY